MVLHFSLVKCLCNVLYSETEIQQKVTNIESIRVGRDPANIIQAVDPIKYNIPIKSSCIGFIFRLFYDFTEFENTKKTSPHSFHQNILSFFRLIRLWLLIAGYNNIFIQIPPTTAGRPTSEMPFRSAKIERKKIMTR